MDRVVWIRTISWEDSEGDLRAAYDWQASRLGAPAEFTMLGSLYPPIVEERLRLYRAVEGCPSALTAEERLLAAFVTSLLNGTTHCASGLRHRLLVSRVTGIRVAGIEGDGHYAQLILTLGVALILENGGLILFGSTPQSVRTPLSSSAWELPLLHEGSAIFVNKARSIAALISVAAAVGLYWFIGRSRLGKALRAAADNPEAATYMGIDVDRAHRIAFGIGTGVTAVAGGLVATYSSFQPYVGLEFVIIMYAGVVLGGMGSMLGAFWGGMTIGLVQQLSSLVLSPQLQNSAIFVVFLAIVLLRPQGLFGRGAERT
jgi:branched-chain amino acid transport system permease protein